MTLLTFSLGVLALLIMPGPTNAVLAMASAGITATRLLSLLGAVLAAYLIVIIPVSGIAGPYLQAHPVVAQSVRIVSAIWVLSLALKLWKADPDAGATTVGPRHLFVTTLLNPKAIIIGLAMVPAVQVTLALAILSFAACVTLTSAIWIGLGRLITGNGSGMPLLAQRCGSAVLMAFSITLAVSAVT